jgi:beta-aspartyl-dipeptidase (metallo-type)
MSQSSITLIQGAQVYAPQSLGQLDVMIVGDRIVAIAPQLPVPNIACRVIDGRGKWLVPGFVDALTHITGGGGEGGFHTRTPEMQLSDAILAGVTTVTGVLGTDAITRSHQNLIAKARALKTEGLNVVCHTGSYHLPAKSLMASIEDDLLFIPEFIGVGEVAISDHRSSQPDATQLAQLAAQTRVAGMLSGKRGVVSIHVGDAPSLLQPLWDAVASHDVTLSQFYPTHINRNATLLLAGFEHVKRGGYIDFTASTTDAILAGGEVRASEAVMRGLSAGIPESHMSMSTDGHASLPVFDDAGNLVALTVGEMASLHTEWVYGVQTLGIAPEKLLRTLTQTPAEILGLADTGTIAEGSFADVLLLDADSLDIQTVICRGQWMMHDGVLLKLGTFEVK